MKKLLIIICLVTVMISSVAQDLERKGYIGIMMGPSFPYGSFASGSNYYDGYAKTGLNINLLNFGYKIWKNIGISAAWVGIANPIDYYGTDGMWGVGAIMAGPFFSIPLSEKTNFDVKGMFGYVLETKQMESNDIIYAYGSGYQLGFMLRHNLAKRWSLLFDLESFNTQLDIQPEEDPKVALINFTFGIAYLLK